MQLFLDLDGVLVDFDGHYAAVVGPLPDRNDPSRDVDWKKIGGMDFFESAPPMPDADELFDFARPYNPIILTGVPSTGYQKAALAKVKWVKKHFGPYVPVLTTKSEHKSFHAKPGDILVDDWEKYKHKWIEKGGLWVTHRNAFDSIAELKGLGL